MTDFMMLVDIFAIDEYVRSHEQGQGVKDRASEIFLWLGGNSFVELKIGVSWIFS
jgi:hypothetical protein